MDDLARHLDKETLMKINALIVTKERTLAERLARTLVQAGRSAVTETHVCHTLDAALRLASHYAPNLVFVDEAYGLETVRPFLRELRLESPTSVNVMLTAVAGAGGMGVVLRAGARDYVPYDGCAAAAVGRVLKTVRQRSKPRRKGALEVARSLCGIEDERPGRRPLLAGIPE